MANQSDILKWCNDGISEGSEFMLIVQDDSTGCSYPNYVTNKSNALDLIEQLEGNEEKEILEIYDLTQNLTPQIESEKAWAFDQCRL